MTSSRDSLKRHKANMQAAGFKRLAVWVHPDLVAEITKQRQPNECGGRTLERLVLGAARPRPRFYQNGDGK